MFYIVTEYCGAGTLGDFATKENLVWTPARFGEVMGQVFNAVEYMHGVGLVHLGRAVTSSAEPHLISRRVPVFFDVFQM